MKTVHLFLFVAVILIASLIVPTVFDLRARANRVIATTNATEIGTLTSFDGDAEVLNIKTLQWSTLRKGEALKSGARIRTKRNSTALATLISGPRIFLGSNSMVSFHSAEIKPFIGIFYGIVNVEPNLPGLVDVYQDGELKDSHREPDQTQVTSLNPLPSPEFETEQDRDEDGDGLDASTPTEQPTEKEKLVSAPHTSGFYPFPKDKTVFLHNGRGKVDIQPVKVCVAPCFFEIRGRSGHVYFSQQYSESQVPIYTLKIFKSFSESFHWIFRSSGYELSGTFAVDAMSTENFSTYLDKDFSIEILN